MMMMISSHWLVVLKWMVMMLPQTPTRLVMQMRMITWFTLIKSRNIYLWLSNLLDTIVVNLMN